MSAAHGRPKGRSPSLGEVSRSDRRAVGSAAHGRPKGRSPSLGEVSRSDRRAVH